MNAWEFDSHLDVTSSGKTRLMQVWSRESTKFPNERDWVVTENKPGIENPPKLVGRNGYGDIGHWTSLEAFKKQFPHFNR